MDIMERGLLMPNQQLSQLLMLMLGILHMAMDMDMVWATMDMDIDMVVMDMQLTGHMVMDIMERGLLMPNQQLSQQQMLMLMLMLGILPMDMDMAMVLVIIDMVVMDMQLTGHMDMDIMESSSAKLSLQDLHY